MSAAQTALVAGGVLVTWGGGYYLLQRYIERLRKQIAAVQDPCDYVVLEASPSHLPLLEADFAEHRWRLANAEPSRSGAMLYRFEKIDFHSALLSQVLDSRTSMKRTSNRPADGEGPVKIKAQGRRSELHG